MSGEQDPFMIVPGPLIIGAFIIAILMLASYVVLRAASSRAGLRVLRAVVHRIYRRR